MSLANNAASVTRSNRKVQQSSDEPTKRVTPIGTAVVSFVRTLVLSLKKGAILSLVKKNAFVRLGSLTSSRRLTAAAANVKRPIGAAATWGDIAKTVVLGMTVFATYETLAYHWLADVRDPDVVGYSKSLSRYVTIKLGKGGKLKMDEEEEQKKQREKFRLKKSAYAEVAEQSSVLSHVGAGLCSGIAQSCVQVLWEQAIVRDHPHSLRYIQRRAIHHSIGYASLFGSYELLRRNMTRAVHDGLVAIGRDDPDMIHEFTDWLGPEYECLIRREDGVIDVTPVTLFTSFLAGGFAGQVHHVVSHYSRSWLTKRGRVSKLLLRPTLASFGPTSVIFLAFQFGGELSERMVEDLSHSELLRES